MNEGRSNARNGKIRVVVGEDSPLIRTMIVNALESDPEIKVVGHGSDGRAVLKSVAELKPDCITLDLEMPRMDGLETLRYIMSEWPTPVVIVSGYSAVGANLAITCLEYGAVDFVAKTGGGKRFPAEELIAKVKAAASVDVGRMRFAHSEIEIGAKQRKAFASSLGSVVVIGASTGGPQALMEIIPKLPRDIPAGIVIVQHMPPNFTSYLAERLDARSHLDIHEAKEGDAILPGRALVAPGGKHLFLEERDQCPCVMILEKNALQRTACPSIDFAMTSFVPIFRERLIGVILTGMGRDGAAGSAAIHLYGGKTICQDKESSLIYGMPGSVIGNNLADEVCPLGEIADCIIRNVREIGMREPVYERERL
ncbi:MAG: chemotaxis-specific protein-glutamate methyltransferase CheB [Candidatus Krumholzibacteria bacterium]|nr:chemotaxis-specific protein-glutamate methyltransferase CheB [Candidatus Krumholzibacteria bacterium]